MGKECKGEGVAAVSLRLKSEENMKQPPAGMGREWVVELSKETRSLVMDASSLVHT